MNDPTPGSAASASRRSVLGGAAMIGAGALLAACGADGDATTAVDRTTATAGGAGTEVGKASSVPVGGGIYSGEAKAFVSQPTEGTFKAFAAICTHKQCPISKLEGDIITCQCHGSQFSVLDGSVKHGPATSPLAAVKVVDKGGTLFVQG